LKLRSCVTLFVEIADDEPILYETLEDLFNGQLDERTIDLIDQMK
jgi:uncharacterized protein (DUF1810 family)